MRFICMAMSMAWRDSLKYSFEMFNEAKVKYKALDMSKILNSSKEQTEPKQEKRLTIHSPVEIAQSLGMDQHNM